MYPNIFWWSLWIWSGSLPWSCFLFAKSPNAKNNQYIQSSGENKRAITDSTSSWISVLKLREHYFTQNLRKIKRTATTSQVTEINDTFKVEAFCDRHFFWKARKESKVKVTSVNLSVSVFRGKNECCQEFSISTISFSETWSCCIEQ